MIGWGIFFLVLAFFSASAAAASHEPSAYFAVVLWAAVGSVLIARGRANRQKQQQTQQQTVIVNNYTAPPETTAPSMKVRTSASVYTPKRFAVAGVTFDNDDGSSRQDILRGICGGEDEGETEAWLEWYQFQGHDAYRVMTSAGCVGNVRKSDIHDAVVAIGGSNVDLNVELFVSDDGREIYRADLVV